MDPKWVKEVKGMTVKQQWDLLFNKKKKIQQNGRSIWGPGNVYKNSAKLVELLPELFKELDIKSFVDIGCGDFLWLSKLDWSNIKYNGFDIVQGLIRRNKRNYTEFDFNTLNLIEDIPPKADMIFMRSVFIHTSLGDCKKMIDNIKTSGSKYLMASTLPRIEKNIDTSCLWLVQRNLQIEPFNFPEPLYLVPERIGKENQLNNYMGVWLIEDLK